MKTVQAPSGDLPAWAQAVEAALIWSGAHPFGVMLIAAATLALVCLIATSKEV